LVSDGQFGAYMQVGIQNDGPVTITLDTASPVCICVLLVAGFSIHWIIVM